MVLSTTSTNGHTISHGITHIHTFQIHAHIHSYTYQPVRHVQQVEQSCRRKTKLEFHFFEQKKRLELMKKMPENRVLLSANMMVTGKVESIHKVDEQFVELNISLLLYDKNQWETYYKKYGWKQEKVNYLFDKFKI